MRALLAAAALAGCVTAPAGAVRVSWNADAAFFPGTDGSGCATFVMRGPIVGAVTSAIVVRTERPAPVLGVQRGAGPPTEHVTDHRTFSTTDDSMTVCLPGTSRRAVGGWGVFSLNASGRDGHVTVVLVCTYSPDGVRCAS